LDFWKLLGYWLSWLSAENLKKIYKKKKKKRKKKKKEEERTTRKSVVR
jgi:hypothetical protein